MELQDFKEEMEDLIGEDKIKVTLNSLKDKVENQDKLKVIIGLKRRHERVMAESLKAIKKRKKIDEKLNLISAQLIDFVYELTETDIDILKVYRNREILYPILVYTEEEKIDTIKAFFLQLNFNNVIVRAFSDKTKLDAKNNIVIFDNQDLDDCPSEKFFNGLEDKLKLKIESRISQMKSIIDDDTKFIIHLGNRLHWINDNRNQVQAANSKFSLYARIKEVIQFVTTYF